MTLLTNTADGGTDGVNVIPPLSGGSSGDPLDSVVPGTGGVVQFDSAHAFQGPLSYKFSQPTATELCFITMVDAPASQWALRFYFYLTSLPSATISFPCGIRTAADSHLARPQITAAGQFNCVVGTTTGSTTSGTPVATGVWYRGEFTGSGLNSTSGAALFRVFVGQSTTAQLSASVSGGTTAALAERAKWGRFSTQSTIGDWWIDSIAVDLGASGELGPAPAPPTGYAGPDQLNVEPWQLITLEATGTGTWTQTGGPAVTLAGSGDTRTFVAPATLAGVTLTFAFGGDSMTVTVLPVTERAVIGGVEVPLQTFGVSS